MNKFEPSNEDIKKPEIQESHEKPKNIENTEQLRQHILSEAEKETDQFKRECGDDLVQVEARAEKDGLVVEAADKAELQKLNEEAFIVKLELEAALTPPPLPEEYLRSTPPPLSQTPPPLPNMPPPLPEDYLQNIQTSLSKKDESGYEKIEDDSRLVEYLQKSKLTDKGEALERLMGFVGASSKSELLSKLNEKDNEGDFIVNMDLFSPESLTDFVEPSVELIQKIKNVGDALGYTYLNTPGYENKVDGLIDKLNRNDRKEDASKVEDIFKDLKNGFEKEKERSEFDKINEELLVLFQDQDKYKEYIDIQKNLPSDAIVHLYHGLNNGGYEDALGILNSPQKGIEQRSGPTLSITPSGGFWKGVGFRYALRRDQVEFPGENNPNAVVKMKLGDDGIPDTGYIVSELGSLPLDKFEADVMRSKFVLPDPENEQKLAEKLEVLRQKRIAQNKSEMEESSKKNKDSQNKELVGNRETSVIESQYKNDLPTAVELSEKADAEKLEALRKRVYGESGTGAEVISNEKFLLAKKHKIEEELDLLADELEARNNRLLPLEDLGGENAVAGEREKTWELIEKITKLQDEYDRISQEHEDVVNARIDKELGR